LQTPISVELPIYYPLVAAIYTLYARPFSRSKIIGRWTKQVVPKKHLDLHEQMMLMRNQLIAHSDAETLLSVSVITRIRDLANALLSKIDAQLDSLWNERNREFPDIVGEYLVDPKLDRFAP